MDRMDVIPKAISMAMNVVDPAKIAGWDEKVRALPGFTFFHTTTWTRVLEQCYRYKPFYLTLTEGSRLTAAIPVMEVSSVFTGKRGVSLPFTDYCEPLVESKEVFNGLLELVKRKGRERGWRYIEFRLRNGHLSGNPIAATHYGHILDLSPGPEALFKKFKNSTRRNIRKSEKEGVEVNLEYSLDAIHEFERLNCLTRRDHGLPPQPPDFFNQLHHHVLSKGAGFVALARFKGKAIAANVYLHHGDQAMYKYGASDKAHQHLRASNLVMWEAIRHYAGNGVKSLCFGRTEPGNTGLRQFKLGWGTVENSLNYYRFDLGTNAFVTKTNGVSSTTNDVFSKLPIPALRVIGNLFYRHMG